MAVNRVEQARAKEFRTWFTLRVGEWQGLKAEGFVLTLNEYIVARSAFLEEKKNG